jgi:hypothetical protein
MHANNAKLLVTTVEFTNEMLSKKKQAQKRHRKTDGVLATHDTTEQ